MSTGRTRDPWIKICGVKDVATAVAIAQLRPAAIGLNFYPPSVRFVVDETARDIVAAVGTTVEIVGVFVNEPLEGILRRVESLPLTSVQLHGDEPVELVAALQEAAPRVRLYRAFRYGAAGLGPIVQELAALTSAGVRLTGILIDAAASGQYGGTGQAVDWDRLRGELQGRTLPPLILAGGLRPENVARACETVSPWGVDVAGGVEAGPGVKALDRVAAFLTAARGLIAD